ncbi:MAG: Tim44/TimA family putative adaptor protein [Alphaproteobacteria bacterium]|nr:Tim44/TimA family putative adaptor protein [Alphaproteobacteria bacterium]
MGSLNYFDIAIMMLFSIVSYSIYKMLRTENNEENIIPVDMKRVKAGKIVKIFKNKKALQHFVLETLKNESLDLKVQKLSKTDKTFDPQNFMSWAKDSFEYIFKSFYSNNNEKIKQKVSDNIYKEFEEFNKNLLKNKQSISAEIIRFKTIMIKDVNLSKKTANVIVEFTTEQTAVMKDLNGKVLKGDDNQIETIRDVWCFSKDYSQKNPAWILTKTIEA